MDEKFELNRLPSEIQTLTAQGLPTRDLAHLMKTSHNNQNFFQPVMHLRKLSFYLLYCVVRGEYETVQRLLKINGSLIFQKNKITDSASRTFECISPFEYALWSLDKHMWEAMLQCLPENNKEIWKVLAVQYEMIKTHGITYRLCGDSFTEQHFDFSNTIIHELRISSVLGRSQLEFRANQKQWISGVGGAQALLPAHVIFEYCSEESFTPVPEFTLRPELKEVNYLPMKLQPIELFGANSGLGTDYAIFKEHARVLACSFPIVNVINDLVAMQKLYEVRLNDFASLKTQLSLGAETGSGDKPTSPLAGI